MTKPKVGQIYKCRDERHGKRWVRIDRIKAIRIYHGIYDLGAGCYLANYAHVSVRRGNSRKWIPSQRTIKLSAFNDKRHQDYKLVREA